MSEEYKAYLNEHVDTVQRGWNWMKDHLLNRIEDWIREQYDILDFDPAIDIFEIDNLVKNHDMSKTKPDEYHAYDNWFYNGKQSFADKQAFELAFLNHIHRNPHHWQYWILIHDDPDEPETLMEIPLSYIFEMICDWWTFSWRKGDLYEIFSWWDEHKDYIRMHKRSRKTVEKILSEMKITLDEEQGQGDKANAD